MIQIQIQRYVHSFSFEVYNNVIYDQDKNETPAEKAARIVDHCAHMILEHIGDSGINPSEFIHILKEDSRGSHQKNEDEAFIRLYRGYSPMHRNEWVHSF